MLDFLRALFKQKRLVSVSYKVVGGDRFHQGVPAMDVVTKNKLENPELLSPKEKGVHVPENRFNARDGEFFKTRFVNIALSQDHVIEINKAVQQNKNF